MHEIGTWATASGTSEAYLDLESGDGDVAVTELPNWVGDALKGAFAGAATGAAAGPAGALVGAATGAALGAASSAGKPAQSSSTASTSADASRTKIVQALQQFAAVVPALVQLLAASGAARKEASIGDAGESFESADGSDWGPESFQGTWTLP
jgi:phage tail tape-measure protein